MSSAKNIYDFVKRGSSRVLTTILSTSSIYLVLTYNARQEKKRKTNASIENNTRVLQHLNLRMNMSYCDENHDELSMNQVAIILGSKIRPIREKQLIEWRRMNIYDVEMPSFQLRAFKSDENLTHCIQLQYSAKHFGYRHAFSWILSNLNILYGKKVELLYDSEGLINDFIAFYTDPNVDQISFRNNNGMKLIVTKVNNPDEQPSLQYFLFKNSGFDEIDLDQLSTAYESAFRYNPIGNNSFQSYQLGKPRPRSPYSPLDMEVLYNIFIIQHPERGLYPRKLVQGNTATDEGVKSLTQQLRRLGVEVFDAANNEMYSWDSLAGYEDIKQQLQETVLNAMQYPDLYDGISRL